MPFPGRISKLEGIPKITRKGDGISLSKYETITPVNSFRIVFNLYFDTDYELLKEESYFWPGPGKWK